MESMNLKDIVVSIREVCLIAVFVLLLATPKWINERLQDAGFKSLDLGIAKWEKTIEESKKEVEEVKQTTEAAQQSLNQISSKLENLTSNSALNNPVALRREVQQLKVQVDESASALDRSKRELQQSLKNHDILLKDIKSTELNRN